MSSRPFALVQTREQWQGALLSRTTLDDAGRAGLTWSIRPGADVPRVDVPAAGLAFDGECRLYRSLPAEGRVQRMHWSTSQTPEDFALTAYDLFRTAEPAAAGDFAAATAPTPLHDPRALAVDENDRLFVVETGARQVLVYDLWSSVLVRRVHVSPATPLDVAAYGSIVYVLLDSDALLAITGRDTTQRIFLPPEITAPSRLAVSPAGGIAVLDAAGTATARVFFLAADDSGSAAAQPALLVEHSLAVPHARDVEFDGADALYVARRAGESILRFGPVQHAPMLPIRARLYDGTGIVRTPEGRVGFWGAGGLSYGMEDRVLYEATGLVTTIRLDAGDYQREWGRLFVDACLPRGTGMRAGFTVTDDDDLVAAHATELHALYERETGPELPWANLGRSTGTSTFECPVLAPPGRYLWVTFELTGDTRHTPLVSHVRVEFPAHDHLRRLPRTLSREPAAAGFLQRYLGNLDGLLTDLDARAAQRHVLVLASTAPAEILGWLASFVGLVLDERWSECARRTAIAEAAWLFRYRGTVPGLRRFLEIGVGGPVILIEHFKLRGQGGALLGDTGPAFTSSVLGAGFRIGGAIGSTATPVPMSGTLDDAFKTHAHRFTVIIPGRHGPDTIGIATLILDVHRPAHTVFDLCTVGAGMRVGRGLHVGLSAMIGRTGGFHTLQLDASVLGRDGIVGRPTHGVRVQSTTLGDTGGGGFH